MNTEATTSFSPRLFDEGLPELELPILTDIIEEASSSLMYRLDVPAENPTIGDALFSMVIEEVEDSVNAMPEWEEQEALLQLDQAPLDFSDLPTFDFDEDCMMNELPLDEVLLEANLPPAMGEAVPVDTHDVIQKSETEKITTATILGSEMDTQREMGSKKVSLASKLATEPRYELRRAGDMMDEALPDSQSISIIKVATGVKTGEVASASVPRRLPIALFNDTVLIEALYQTVLPRMKAEVSIWLHDTLESQVKQMMGEVLHRFEQDCDHWFSTTLRDTLNQAIDNLRREEP